MTTNTTRKRATRYGMAASTIRYWQNQAVTLRLHNGIYIEPVTAALLPTASARDIAHRAIGAAAVHNATEMRQLLQAAPPRPTVAVDNQAAVLAALRRRYAARTKAPKLDAWQQLCESVGTRCTVIENGERCTGGVTTGTRCAAHATTT